MRLVRWRERDDQNKRCKKSGNKTKGGGDTVNGVGKHMNRDEGESF